MAHLADRLASNVEGDFFVDASCIDCDACRIFAPTVFRDRGGQSAVVHQPESEQELLEAQRALLSCPTSSIGSVQQHDMREALASLPQRIDPDVYRCGFTAESSFGAFSYYLGDRNILIDSPRFSGPLVKNIERLGGVRRLLLTHQDDLADHEKFHERFGCERVLHAGDARPFHVETKPEGIEPLLLEEGLVMIPTPGHTRGHAMFLYRDKFLFTGDSLAWSERLGHLYAFYGSTWYSWAEQIQSMQRLLAFSFEWVLPGHGRPIHLPAAEMRASLVRCIAWMQVHEAARNP